MFHRISAVLLACLLCCSLAIGSESAPTIPNADLLALVPEQHLAVVSWDAPPEGSAAGKFFEKMRKDFFASEKLQDEESKRMKPLLEALIKYPSVVVCEKGPTDDPAEELAKYWHAIFKASPEQVEALLKKSCEATNLDPASIKRATKDEIQTWHVPSAPPELHVSCKDGLCVAASGTEKATAILTAKPGDGWKKAHGDIANKLASPHSVSLHIKGIETAAWFADLFESAPEEERKNVAWMIEGMKDFKACKSFSLFATGDEKSMSVSVGFDTDPTQNNMLTSLLRVKPGKLSINTMLPPDVAAFSGGRLGDIKPLTEWLAAQLRKELQPAAKITSPDPQSEMALGFLQTGTDILGSVGYEVGSLSFMDEGKVNLLGYWDWRSGSVGEAKVQELATTATGLAQMFLKPGATINKEKYANGEIWSLRTPDTPEALTNLPVLGFVKDRCYVSSSEKRLKQVMKLAAEGKDVTSKTALYKRLTLPVTAETVGYGVSDLKADLSYFLEDSGLLTTGGTPEDPAPNPIQDTFLKEYSWSQNVQYAAGNLAWTRIRFEK